MSRVALQTVHACDEKRPWNPSLTSLHYRTASWWLWSIIYAGNWLPETGKSPGCKRPVPKKPASDAEDHAQEAVPPPGTQAALMAQLEQIYPET